MRETWLLCSNLEIRALRAGELFTRTASSRVVFRLRLIKVGAMTKHFAVTLFVAGAVAAPSLAEAHCQVPCGIYDDHARVHAMREDIATIRKAVTQIQKLASKRDPQSQNQLVRWVNTKESHAERIIRVVSDYFLTQKIKPVDSGDKNNFNAYLGKLQAHHAVMAAAMKCKQTVATSSVDALSKALNGIETYWPKKS